VPIGLCISFIGNYAGRSVLSCSSWILPTMFSASWNEEISIGNVYPWDGYKLAAFLSGISVNTQIWVQYQMTNELHSSMSKTRHFIGTQVAIKGAVAQSSTALPALRVSYKTPCKVSESSNVQELKAITLHPQFLYLWRINFLRPQLYSENSLNLQYRLTQGGKV